MTELNRPSRTSQVYVWSTAGYFVGRRQDVSGQNCGAQQHAPQAEGSTAQLWLSEQLCFLRVLQSMHWDERRLLILSYETNCMKLLRQTRESSPDTVFNSETNIYLCVTEEERLVDCNKREMKVKDKFHFPAVDQLQSRYQQLGDYAKKSEEKL